MQYSTCDVFPFIALEAYVRIDFYVSIQYVINPLYSQKKSTRRYSTTGFFPFIPLWSYCMHGCSTPRLNDARVHCVSGRLVRLLRALSSGFRCVRLPDTYTRGATEAWQTHQSLESVSLPQSSVSSVFVILFRAVFSFPSFHPRVIFPLSDVFSVYP